MSTASKLTVGLLLGLLLLGAALRRCSDGHDEAWAVVVENAAARTPAQGAIYTSPLVLAAAQERGVQWRVVDQAEAGPDLAEVEFALKAAHGQPLPVLVTRRGRVQAQPLPATPEATAAVLRGL